MSENNVLKIADTSRNPDVVLEKSKGLYSSLLVIGFNKDDGKIQYSSDSKITKELALWLLEHMKFALLNGEI